MRHLMICETLGASLGGSGGTPVSEGGIARPEGAELGAMAVLA